MKVLKIWAIVLTIPIATVIPCFANGLSNDLAGIKFGEFKKVVDAVESKRLGIHPENYPHLILIYDVNRNALYNHYIGSEIGYLFFDNSIYLMKIDLDDSESGLREKMLNYLTCKFGKGKTEEMIARSGM